MRRARSEPQRRGARPPEPQPQREPRRRQEAGAPRRQRLRGRRPRRRHPGPAWPQPPPTRWPGGPPIRGARGPGACGGGAGARAGCQAGGTERDRACAGAGVPARGFLRSYPGSRGPHSRGGRAPREEAGLGLRAPGAGSRALSWALLSPAVRCRGRGPAAPR